VVHWDRDCDPHPQLATHFQSTIGAYSGLRPVASARDVLQYGEHGLTLGLLGTDEIPFSEAFHIPLLRWSLRCVQFIREHAGEEGDITRILAADMDSNVAHSWSASVSYEEYAAFVSSDPALQTLLRQLPLDEMYNNLQGFLDHVRHPSDLIDNGRLLCTIRLWNDEIRFGWVPPLTRSGDTVHCIGGGMFPIILRSAGSKSAEYSVVGDACFLAHQVAEKRAHLRQWLHAISGIESDEIEGKTFAENWYEGGARLIRLVR
jgi:hypothetical protein